MALGRIRYFVQAAPVYQLRGCGLNSVEESELPNIGDPYGPLMGSVGVVGWAQ